MGPNTPEQNPPEKSMQQQAQEAADRAIAQIRSSYENRFADIAKIEDAGERAIAREALAREAQQKLGEEIKQAISSAETTQADTPDIKKQKAENAKRIFLEAKELQKENINVVNPQSQALVDKIVEKIKSGDISDSSALTIERVLGKQIIDGIVFSKPGEQLSSTEEGFKNLLQIDPQTAHDLLTTIVSNPETYGTTRENVIQKMGMQTPENNPNSQRDQTLEDISTEAFKGDFIQYYRSRFTQDQIELISTFYSPESFVTYIEALNDGRLLKGGPEEANRIKQEMTENVKKYWQQKNEPLSNEKVKEEVDKQWGEKVSNEMTWRISDVINQLFLELQQKSPNKFYEEVMQEDPFQGPGMIQKKIQAAINALMTKVDQIEKNSNDPLYKRIKNLKLYRTTADPGYIEERSSDPKDVNKKLYPRLNPLPYGGEIKNLSEFVQHVNITIDQTIHKAEYFHNSRAIYNHPAGEKGFYGQLGGFAEMLKGADIDEIMLLPDGKYIMQAYQLYEKMLEEDFAQLDWKHRPDQFTNQLERVNSKIEIEVFKQLKAFYPELTDSRLNTIRNSARGIATGIFLTEAEKSAYADPVDAEGKGMVASYSTNDAQSLNVFNPLHNALRWQGEHNWNMMYFMPVRGQEGSWDHKQAWNNMARYMDSFIVGKGRGTGKEKLPELFADAMIDINNVGGPNKRKGWRMQYSLDGYYVYDDDNTINALNTFKAMEAIGYEAINNFIETDQMGEKLLKASNKNDKNYQEREKLFKYIFKRYFSDDPNKFQESDLDNYLLNLRKDGEKNALKKIKKNGGTTSFGTQSIIDGPWEEQVTYETSKLFMENARAHYIATKFPSKFLRIDRNRFAEDGVSLWEKVFREFRDRENNPWNRAEFDQTMKDLNMAEMLLNEQKSEIIRGQIGLDREWKLHMLDEKFLFILNKDNIEALLKNKYKGKGEFKKPKEIARVIELWEHIRDNLYKNNSKYDNKNYLDAKATETINKYTFTFGLEDTDISLIAYRGTGPRMTARAIKDIGSIEQNVTQWMLKMPDVMSEIAVNGKHDFTPLIEYLRTAKKAINDVHGSEPAQEFGYKIAGAVINYFKKDAMAKPLFGLFRLGQRNSIAAEYAGRSSAVWEWDSRDIDRFCVALESYRIIPHNPYDANKTERAKLVNGKWVKGKFIGGQLEDRWIKLPGLKPFRFGKKRHVDFEYNGTKLRKEHGADWKAISWDMFNQFVPLAIVFLLWKYIKDAMDEASGKKK